MQQMQEIIMNQSASMQDTQKVVEEVIAQIGSSMQSILRSKKAQDIWKIPEMKCYRR